MRRRQLQSDKTSSSNVFHSSQSVWIEIGHVKWRKSTNRWMKRGMMFFLRFFSLQGSNLMKQKWSFVNCCLCVCPTLINQWGDDERHRHKARRWMYPWACAHVHMKVYNKQRAAAFAIISPWGSGSLDRKGSVWESIFTFHMHLKTSRHKFFPNACCEIFKLVRLFLFCCHIINICSSFRNVLVLAAWLHFFFFFPYKYVLHWFGCMDNRPRWELQLEFWDH